MADQYTLGSQDFTGRIVELWRAGRPIHLAVGDEISRYGTALQNAGTILTEDRKKEGKPRPVHVIFHDRYCGFYQGLPSVTPCTDKTNALGLALQLAVTKLGFSVKKLAPDPKRLNPLSKITQLPRQNLTSLVQAVIMLPLFCYAIYAVASDQLDRFSTLPLISVRAGMSLVTDSVKGLLWKAASLLLVFGLVELFREQKRQTSQLKMTKQEVKDEHKESEGNPQVKAKIRALRRDQARKRMMKAVPTASAVIVNPTHFAVAIKYEPDTMAAPLVVAKGKNYLALRIRQLALENQVPLIENPPLARALYKSVDVGQEIPAHLYRAVAEILAYIFKIMNRNLNRR